MIGETLGHYRILEKLGAGGMGEVYLAQDTELDRKVALKVLPEEMARSPERLERFRREAQTLASLNHPNIVVVYSVEAVDRVHFLTMELLEGKTLSDYIPKRGVPLKDFFKFAIPLTDALSTAHDQGVIHRDLKPSNVMLTASGTVKVLDFGLAKLVATPEMSIDTAATTEPLTGEGWVLGTVPYMSPEQLRGDPIDHRSDIFSVGIILYQLATGDRPFTGTTSAEIVSSILRDKPTAVDDLKSEMPHHIGRIVAACLEKDPERRFQSIKDVRNELVRLRRELTTKDMKAQPAATRSRSRHALAGRLVASLLAVVGVVLAVNYLRDQPEPVIPIGNEAQGLLDQGHLFEMRGDTLDNLEAAEDRYRRALKLEPENPAIQARLAAHLARIQMIYPSQERADEIRELAGSALEQYPELADALIARGRLALLEGDEQAAEVAARTVVNSAPERYCGYTLLGEVLLVQDRADEGFVQLRQGVELAGTDMRARLTLARKLWHLGRTNEAAAEYETVLRYTPDSPNALNNLGSIYGQQGRFLDAIPLFKKLLEIRDDEMAAMNLANCYLYLDRLDEAVEAYEQAIEIAPGKPYAQHGLAEAYEKQGNDQAARESYEKAIESYDAELAAGGSRASYLGARGVCAAKLDRHAEAQENVEEALDLAPDRVTPLFNAAQVYALANDREQTFLYTKRAIESGYARQEFERDLSFASLKGDPEFQALIETPAIQ